MNCWRSVVLAAVAVSMLAGCATIPSVAPATSTQPTSNSTQNPPGASRTVAVAEGEPMTSATCAGGCRYVVISLAGFTGDVTCSISMEDSSGVAHSDWRSYTVTGDGSHQTDAYLGYWGHPVWAVCDGVASPRKNWSKP